MSNEEPTMFPVTAATYRNDLRQTWYIADLPRKVKSANGKMVPKMGYADWGYTTKPSQAIALSRYWWRRFRSDMHHCNNCAMWWPANR